MKACRDCKHYVPWGRCTRYPKRESPDFFNGRIRHVYPIIDAAREQEGKCGPDARGFEEASWWRRATVGVRELLHAGGYVP